MSTRYSIQLYLLLSVEFHDRSVPTAQSGRSEGHIMLPTRHAAATARSPGSVGVVLQQERREKLHVGGGSSVLNKDLVQATGIRELLSTFVQNRYAG